MTHAAPPRRLLLADAHAAHRLGSDVRVALIAYLVNQAKGGEITAPGLKR